MHYSLPTLSYVYGALEPVIDAKTMEIHHTKHHQAYVDKLNAVLGKYPEYAEKKLETLLGELDRLQMDTADKTALKNHGGGHLNHSLFWKFMDPQNEKDQKLVQEITITFGSVESFKEQFSKTALAHFGSGWAWLARNERSGLEIYSLPNQDSPYLKGHTPLLGLDVWEHAYYLKYQNRRAEYIENWWKVVKVI